LFATADGVVTFEWAVKGRKQISVYPQAPAGVPVQATSELHSAEQGSAD
jgi:hypothetical protein